MEFSFTREQEAFRQEVRAFLKKEIPAGWLGRHFIWMTEDEWRTARLFDRRLGAKNWLAMAWPKKDGGQDRSHIEQLIFNEEMGYHHAPNGGGWAHGPVFVGPTIIHYGSEEQKARYLPPIARGEIIWCQSFSEPNAGSDLAALETKAVKDGDDYILTGEKHFVGQGQRADWTILLARTDPSAPKHKGVSLFIMDMHAPGVSVQLQPTLPRYGAQSRIIMDNVRVPKTNLVGQENNGFYQAMTALDYERNRIMYAAECHRTVDDLWAYCRENGLLKNQVLHNKLAERKIEAKVAILLNYRIAWMQNAGLVANYEASIAKMYTEEFRQRVSRTGIEALGFYGQLGIGSKYAPFGGNIEDYFLAMVSSTMVGGTSEIQRNIVATRGLGLPRG